MLVERGLWNASVPMNGAVCRAWQALILIPDLAWHKRCFFLIHLLPCVLLFSWGKHALSKDSPFTWVNGNSTWGLLGNYQKKKMPSIYFSSLGIQQNQSSCLIYEDELFYLHVELKQSYFSFCTVGKPVPGYNGHKWALLISYHIF